MALGRRLYNVAKAEARSAASRVREAAGRLWERRSERSSDAFDEWAERERIRRQIEEEIASEGFRTSRRATEDPMVREYYANLELPIGASLEEVKAAYRRLMRRYHPDHHGENADRAQAAHALSHKLRQAYEGLLRVLDR